MIIIQNDISAKPGVLLKTIFWVALITDIELENAELCIYYMRLDIQKFVASCKRDKLRNSGGIEKCAFCLQ